MMGMFGFYLERFLCWRGVDSFPPIWLRFLRAGSVRFHEHIKHSGWIAGLRFQVLLKKLFMLEVF